MLRFLSTGESHGPALVALLDGFPAGMKIDLDLLNKELQARQKGYGRSNRQQIETDSAELISGVRHGITSGAPIGIVVRNRDYENWNYVMSVSPVDETEEEVKSQLAGHKITCFRPGHADLSGTIKFRQRDVRDVIERASARETACRVAAGALCLQFLRALGVRIVAHVLAVGSAASKLDSESLSMDELEKRIEASEVFCTDQDAVEAMKNCVRQAWQDGDSLGGVVEVVAEGLPVGLGSYTQWDEKLDGQLAQALMSIQAIKAVEIGDGIAAAAMPGSAVHDALYPDGPGELPFLRKTNRAGGIEGGVTNGARLLVRCFMKPIPTLIRGLPSVSFPEYAAANAHYERSDVCAVPATSVVAKSMTAVVLARAIMQKFGSDTFAEISENLTRHRIWCKAQGRNRGEANPDVHRLPEKETE